MTKKIGKDLKEFLSEKISGMAESHIEGWSSRYEGYKRNDLKYDLNINHDPSIEVEYTEENLNRKLTDDEFDYLIDKFNKEVVKQYFKS